MTFLDDPVLTLNRNWQVVTFLPVRVAIATSTRDMCSIMDPTDYTLHSFEEWCAHDPKTGLWIKTTSVAVPVPEVIVLKRYGERPPRQVAFSRPNVYRRDDYSCQYCGKQLPIPKLSLDHVLPRSRGGPTSWENTVAACHDCNGRKADQTPKEARMKLRKQPHKPHWSPKLSLPRLTRPSWVPFLEREGVV